MDAANLLYGFPQNLLHVNQGAASLRVDRPNLAVIGDTIGSDLEELVLSGAPDHLFDLLYREESDLALCIAWHGFLAGYWACGADPPNADVSEKFSANMCHVLPETNSGLSGYSTGLHFAFDGLPPHPTVQTLTDAADLLPVLRFFPHHPSLIIAATPLKHLLGGIFKFGAFVALTQTSER